MDRSTIAYLLLASSMLIYMTGCKTSQPQQLTAVATGCASLIDTRIHTATYNTQIDFFGRHFSGLLVFKATSDTVERAVFITETGFKFFDFEFTPHSFTVHYCLPSLHKKIVIKTLQRDLGYLSDFSHKDRASVSHTSGNLIHRIPMPHGRYNYYTTDSSCTGLKAIETGTDTRKTITIAIDSFQNSHPTALRIDDQPAHLHITMKEIER